MTQGKGRGVFATSPIKYGETIVIEKPIATASNPTDVNSKWSTKGQTIIVAKKLSELV